MDYEEMCRILNNSKASKEQLRSALATSLGVEYVPASKEKKESIFNECKAHFFRFYANETGLTYSFSGQDAKALKELIAKVESIVNFPATDEMVVITFGLLLEKLPDWYRKNAFSIPVINKKFNEIVSSIKQSNGKGQSSISNSYKEKLLRDLQS
ncbi:MAG TPA: hypothetical protein DEG28_06625 [Porphyromonadaceae bacterium]|nr:hypothetical protein [Porphyromonadaceae bacterium]